MTREVIIAAGGESGAVDETEIDLQRSSGMSVCMTDGAADEHGDESQPDAGGSGGSLPAAVPPEASGGGIAPAKPGDTGSGAGSPTTFSLDRFSDGDYITKAGMAELFGRSERTIQRMVERFEIPPPRTAAGRKVWRAGKLKAWLAWADDRAEADALEEARRLKLLK